MIRWKHYKKGGCQSDYEMNFDMVLIKKRVERSMWKQYIKDGESDKPSTNYYTGDPDG